MNVPEIAIEAHGLTRRFGSVAAVNEVELCIPRGRIYGFLGPNVSGKSTTIRLLCGLIKPSSGTIRVLGLDIPRQAEALRRRVGYMTQRFSLWEDLSARENLAFMASIYTLEARHAAQRIAGAISEYRLAEFLDRPAGTLSGGQKQRLALAAATLHDPQLLMLDEPTSAVDPQSRRDFWESLFALTAAGTTILVSTHYMDEAERCHRIAILDRGVLAADDTPQALMSALAGRSLAVDSAQPRPMQRLLMTLPFVISVAQIGNQLRVLTASHSGNAQHLSAAIAASGLQARVTAIASNLEDVFVAATQTHSSAPQERA